MQLSQDMPAPSRLQQVGMQIQQAPRRLQQALGSSGYLGWGAEQRQGSREQSQVAMQAQEAPTLERAVSGQSVEQMQKLDRSQSMEIKEQFQMWRTTSDLSPAALLRLRDGWLAQARGEQASVLGFENHYEELKKLEAPAHLLDHAVAAAHDELRHAQMCVTLASRFDPDGKEFEVPDVERKMEVSDTMESMITKLACEGCWGEMVGTLVAARQFQTTKDPQVCEILQTITREEFQHCLSAWNTAAWAINKSGAPLREHFKLTLEKLKSGVLMGPSSRTSGPAHMPEVERYGIISSETHDEIEKTEGSALVSNLLAHLLEHSETIPFDETCLDFRTIVMQVTNRIARTDVIHD